MAGKQISGDGLASNLAGMSKNQLYDIMSQMKSLIEQNQHQARQILIQNPLLTRALFQAQIMLGMVKPPQLVPLPSTQPQAPQQPSPLQQANVQVVHSKPSQAGPQEQPNVSQAQLPIRKQPQSQPSAPMSSTPVQGFHSQPAPSQLVEQPRGHMNPLPTQLPHPQASQVSNMPSLLLHSGSQPPAVSQPPMQLLPSHLHQPMQTGGVAHHALQPPLPPQPRPMQVPYQPAMSSNLNFPNAGIPQMPHSQPMFHPSSRPGGMAPSFHQGQLPLPSQPPHQPPYQMGGLHMGTDFSNQGGSITQMERGTPWPPVSRENAGGPPPPGPLPLGAGQMPLSNQPPRVAPLTPEAEQALLQQVMSLTPDQINGLPPEQRQQVLQLQQMLRQ